MRSRLAGLVLLTFSAALPLFAQTLTPVPTRDAKILKRWSLSGGPRALTVTRDGTIYVGLADAQAVLAIDARTGAIRKQVVLDSAEIASTKELVTMRTNRDGTRLYIANGSDESASILSLPQLTIMREITMEGEVIRDALSDPRGRYLYLLGRRVHVFDANGEKELRTLPFEDPMALAASADGATIAVIGSETFGENKATVVALYETTNFTELTRDPMQTDKTMESAMFADNDHVLLALARDWLYEKPLSRPTSKAMTAGSDGRMRMTIGFGDLTSSERICLPEASGPQIAALASPQLLLFAERRCASSGGFTGSNRRVAPASLYGVSAYAVAYEPSSNTLITTEKSGFLTIYRVPRVAVVK
ncbi:MAG: hypothetical protein ABI837_09925 [Acidobacteriota bacterium]